MFAENTVRKPVDNVPEAPKTGIRIVESRFGSLEIADDAHITLPNGLLGFSEFHDFALAMLPNGRHPQFRVLQSLTTEDLAFLVAPLNIDSGAIDDADLSDACATLGIARETLTILLIVTVRRDEAGAQVSVNLRAPVFIDSTRMVGRQYVLPNNRYSIRHVL